MRDRWFRSVLLLPLVVSLTGCMQATPSSQRPSTPSPSPTPVTEKKLEYNVYPLERSIVHTLKIPVDGQYIVTTAVADGVKTVEEFATDTQAIAVINGGYFDPNNRKTTSALFQDGKQVAKPEDNDRLMTNPDLLPYLDKILNRTEFRRYQCGALTQYDIVQRQELPPVNCQLLDAVGAGPRLLPFLNLQPEGFLDVQAGQVVRDSLAQNQPNARSAIGITRDGSILWAMATQRPDAPKNSGLTLTELANFMKQRGVEQAMNLDGGSSSSLFFQGETFYGKVNDQGEAIARPVKSVLLVKSIKKPETHTPASP